MIYLIVVTASLHYSALLLLQVRNIIIWLNYIVWFISACSWHQYATKIRASTESCNILRIENYVCNILKSWRAKICLGEKYQMQAENRIPHKLHELMLPCNCIETQDLLAIYNMLMQWHLVLRHATAWHIVLHCATAWHMLSMLERCYSAADLLCPCFCCICWNC